ncbi:MAG: hypothetical protein Q7S40_26320 [Opitutaceae bacterium]|nr:hypothetical protein [Opitutaceae bacterium]
MMLAVAAWGQEPLVAPAPLVQIAVSAPEARTLANLAAAQRAHDLGFLGAAADIYRDLLAQPGADQVQLGLALASVLLDGGRGADAQKILADMPEPRGAAWRLRTGLAALQLRQRDVAQAQWDSLTPEQLSGGDRAWYWFLAGALYDTAAVRDIKRANENYLKAEAAAESDLARARFQLAGEEVRFRLLGSPTENDLRQARENYESFAGKSIGYDAGKSYAVMWAAAGHQPEAIAFLKQMLMRVSRQERAVRDEINFVLGLIADRGRSADGRAALNQLLETGGNPVRQRQALQLLADASRTDPARGQFRGLLDKLIAATPPHPVRESLLFHRAQHALAEKDFIQAEKDAIELRDNFPASPLRVHAFGVLTQSAWEQRRYRLAADNARRAREALASVAVAEEEVPSPGVAEAVSPLVARARARAEFGILEAEASFRAGDFRPAADAYAAVLRDRPVHLDAQKLSALMYQRVLAEIRASPEGAAKVLDGLEDDPMLDLENRWQAEWSLARALQLEGKTREAYDRVSRLLARGADVGALKPDLRARMAWLQAQLSFDAKQYEQTLSLVEKLAPSLSGIDERLKSEIASMVVLLKQRAEFQLGREAAALETGRQLRADYRDAEASIQSFLVEADHFANQEKIDEARLRLTSLVDNPAYKNSPHVPYALFHLAVLSERLGQPKNLEEANKRIEDLVNLPSAAGEADLIFAARLKQGDLLRKLGQFPQAQRAYEDLVNKYPRRPDVVLAQLALAECHNAQSAADDATQMHADIAQQKFEELRDRVDAPRDVRVEAGYNLGELLARRGKPDAAVKVWLRDVIDPFLLRDAKPLEPDAKRRYWLGRTLLRLGELLEQQGKMDEAKTAYLLVLQKQIGHGHAVARNALERLGVAPPKP